MTFLGIVDLQGGKTRGLLPYPLPGSDHPGSPGGVVHSEFLADRLDGLVRRRDLLDHGIHQLLAVFELPSPPSFQLVQSHYVYYNHKNPSR